MRRKWKRLDVAKLIDDNVGGEYARMKWVYGPCNGGEWPRIVMSIYEMLGSTDSFRFSCSRKDDPESWWGDADIPVELGRDAISLMGEYLASRERE